MSRDYLTLGSLFDGIGGWLLAAKENGIKPIWSSEIDEYPMAVSKYHFPSVEQMGDITKLDGATLPPVDIICAGSPCFVAGTKIQTKQGVKNIEDVVAGDMVIADDCRWHKVVTPMINETNEIYTVKAQGLLELQATGNHPFYVKHMKRCGHKSVRTFSEAEWVEVKDLRKGDYLGYPILKTNKNTMQITFEEAWLIGRYIADGYINNSQRSNRPIGQKNHKVIYCIGRKKLDIFKSAVKDYHVCYKNDQTVVKGEIISERLMNLCMLCGRGAENKEIPSVFLDLPVPLLQQLIIGYMSGDGNKQGNLHRATTVSEKLALSLQCAVHKAYRLPAKLYFTKRPKKHVIQGRVVNQKDIYSIKWLSSLPKQTRAVVQDGYIWQPLKSIEKRIKRTTVYNFEVADVHSYTANGIMVHNCQDLSVAGKQEGLDGERSGLFRKAIEIVHRMREATGGNYPSWFVWENVPGAFSSNKGADFRTVLEEITKESIPMPKSGKWAKSGMVRGKQCDISWRVLDAQYWGVPQRRKRIFLIADFREERRPEILFKPEGVPGDSAACKGARQGASPDTEKCIGAAISFEPGITARLGRPPSQDISTTLRASMGDNQTAVVYGIGSYDSNAMKSKNPHSGIYEAGTSRTLDLNGGNPACNQGGMAVVLNDQGGQSMNVTEDKTATLRAEAHGNTPIVAIEGNGARPSHKGDGYKEGGTMYTLNSTEVHGVATFATKSYTEIETSDVSATLKAKGGTCGGGSESYVMHKKGAMI